ncbi:hypothetical protein K458DRAFT_437835, partial [Lentithecium fluviatile CBS 122367]
MHSHLILFVATFAASIVAAPIPAPTNDAVEAASPLTVREANAAVIAPELDIIKREILERLNAIVERRAPGNDPIEKLERPDANDKREPETLGVHAPANDKREPETLGVHAPANDKREPETLGVHAPANDKREPETLGVHAPANDKREPETLGVHAPANDK